MASTLMLQRLRPIALHIVSAVAGFLLSCYLTGGNQSGRDRERVPVPMESIEQSYELWKNGKILESIPICVLGVSSTLEIVYNDRSCVEGFVELSKFSKDVQLLEARLNSHQMTIASYNDALWINLSKREYLDLTSSNR